MAITRIILLGLGFAGCAEAETTRDSLEATSIFNIILGNYETGLRPMKKALVIVDAQNSNEPFCEYVHSRHEYPYTYCPRLWVNFINLLNTIDSLNFNVIVYTMDAYPSNHILVQKPERKVFEYDRKTGALCEGAETPTDVYSVDCTEDKVVVNITGRPVLSEKGPIFSDRDWRPKKALKNTGNSGLLLDHLLMVPNAAILKKNTKAHVINTNLFQDTFTEKVLKDVKFNTSDWWDTDPQETSLDHFFGKNGAEIADLFFVGANLGVIKEAAIAAREKYKYNTFVLMDGVARHWEDQEQTANMRADMEAANVKVLQYISEGDTFNSTVWSSGDPTLPAGYGFDYEASQMVIAQAVVAFSALSYEIATTPDEFTKTEVTLGPVLWALVGVMIGGVIIGGIVTVNYMIIVNPKKLSEEREAGITRTRSGEKA